MAFWLIWFVGCAAAGASIASKKNMNVLGWATVAFLLGIPGILIILLMPAHQPKVTRDYRTYLRNSPPLSPISTLDPEEDAKNGSSKR